MNGIPTPRAEQSLDRRDFISGGCVAAAFGLVAGSLLPKNETRPVQGIVRHDIRHAINSVPLVVEEEE